MDLVLVGVFGIMLGAIGTALTLRHRPAVLAWCPHCHQPMAALCADHLHARQTAAAVDKQ